MATQITLKLSLIFLLSLLHVLSASASASAVATDFILNSCRTTRYPVVCIKSLSPYASTIHQSPRLIALTALSESVHRAQSTKAFVARLAKLPGLKDKEYAAIRDCKEEVGDSVDQLTNSVAELKKLGRAGGQEFIWHMSNLQTWVSGALTDENTCTDGFSGRALNGRIKSSIRARINNVAQVTSNALALCNKLDGN